MFKVNNKDTRTTTLTSLSCLYCQLWTNFTSCLSVFINYFEQVIVCREVMVQPLIHDELVISISVPHHLLCCSGSRHLLAQSSSRNSRTKYQICFKLTVIKQRQLVVLMSFSLTNNRFHTSCQGFYFEHVIAGLVCMVCETQNLLTSQYAVYSEIPLNRNLYHIETSQAIYKPMQII